MYALTSIICREPGTGNREPRLLAWTFRLRVPCFPVPMSSDGKIRAALRHFTSAISSLVRPITSSAHSFARPVQSVMSAPHSRRFAPTAA